MNTTYQTLIVKFSEPITALDGTFGGGRTGVPAPAERMMKDL